VTRAWREAHPAVPLRALLLGVTPQLATMRWPTGTTLLAVDASEDMVAAVWPLEHAPPGSTARVGDWRALDLPDAGIDIALGDCFLSSTSYPEDYRAILRELRRVLRPDGRLVVRLFARPQAREEVADVARALWSARIGSMHALKWRLLMAVQAPDERNVAVAGAWRAFHEICPDRRRLVDKLGWSPESVEMIETFREGSARYSFPTLAEVRSLLAADFDELSSHTFDYDMGERCPTLVLAPRPRGP
jgi:SAM-dependent methyltransferase